MANERFLNQKIIIGAFVVMLFGCATLNVPNWGTETVVIQDDERRLMNRDKELEEALDRSGFVYEDKAINDYLNAFIPKLLPQGVNAKEIHLSVMVIKDPALNAFSLSDGRIYVHIGILAAAENESQVATLLAHEMTHVLNRHVLKSFRSLKNTTVWWESVGLVTGGLGMIVSELAKVSSVSGFSQDLETEADENGFMMVTNAGFDVTQSEIELAYRFHTKFWGKGYATESAKALIEYGFNHLSLSHIIAAAYPENERSRRVLEKCGMLYRGMLDFRGTLMSCYIIYKP
jgi:predicted Zn-dependent protease